MKIGKVRVAVITGVGHLDLENELNAWFKLHPQSEFVGQPIMVDALTVCIFYVAQDPV